VPLESLSHAANNLLQSFNANETDEVVVKNL
jgi:hypothetical protein